jgi:hypothetical protein
MSEPGRRDKEHGDESDVVEQFFRYYVAEIKKEMGEASASPVRQIEHLRRHVDNANAQA